MKAKARHLWHAVTHWVHEEWVHLTAEAVNHGLVHVLVHVTHHPVGVH